MSDEERKQAESYTAAGLEVDMKEGSGETPPSQDRAGEVPYMELYYGTEQTVIEAEDIAPSVETDCTPEIVEAGLEPERVELGGEELAGPAAVGSLDVPEESSDVSSEEGMSDEELSEVIEDICRSKAEEFRMLGYEQVTGKDVWECVSDKYRKTGIPSLHRIVNDILSLKATQFMNWMTMSIYKDAR